MTRVWIQERTNRIRKPGRKISPGVCFPVLSRLLMSRGDGFWFNHYSYIGGAGKGRGGRAVDDLNRVSAGGILSFTCADIVREEA